MRLRSPDKQVLGRLGTTVGLFVLAASLVFTGCDTTVNEEGDPVSVAGDSTDASTTINNPPPGPYDVTGNITGRLVDKASNEPIADVAVTIDAVNADGEPLSDSTNEAGEFVFTDVPAQSEEGSFIGASGDYSIHFNTAEADGNYPENFRAEATLYYPQNEAGGDGDATGISASVTIPLAELSGSISGMALSFGEVPIEGASVALKRDLDIEYNASGSVSDTEGNVVVDSTTTAADGSFAFDAVPEGLQANDYTLDFNVEGAETTFNSSPSLQPVPFSNAGNPDISLGELSVSVPAFELVVPPTFENKSTTPEFVHGFNRPISEAVTAETVEEIVSLNVAGATEKAFDENGNPTLEASFDADRDTLTLTATESLSDGTEGYQLQGLQDLLNAAVDAKYGVSPTVPNVPPFNNFGGYNTIAFDVGEEMGQPSAELVIENVQNTPLDFTDGSVSLDVRVNNTSDIDLKQTGAAAEVLYKAAGDNQFTSVATIPASDMDFGESSVQSVTISGFPFQADADEYGDIEIAAKVTSLNEVESSLATETLSDTDSLGVVDASTEYRDENSEVDGDELVVEFDEPVADIRRGDSASDYFTINETGSGTATSIGDVLEVDGGTTVVVEVTDDGSNTANDRVIVDTGVTDLSGTPVEVGDNDPSTTGDDDNAVDL
ncbi:hypothetical protein BSZ35_07375 [Salinibacter sp. 10B]|uniref:carboxypeptidase-like regulatory domain-containing protein n=1 Tax=Salinibacter sp. 10B TaxID=1923971 RepID=UPI000CF50FE2|nr:carboxypeptidase-like regulatory domain-containing protein [Salinibacter sp. 10B]PQJ34445.1 hypothetical protein BSZ35_07375 [Salinibacter sp. 10B]